jgi:6-phosphogluconate dehydrogenase
MELGLIGLGRMGNNIARRLLKYGHQVVIYDLIPENLKELVGEGATGADTISQLVQQLKVPCAVWVMVPAGESTEMVINSLAECLSPGDIILDGGNSNYKDSLRRAAALETRQIALLDVGTSGGVWGLAEGFCLMIGGKPEAFHRLESIFQSLAFDNGRGYAYVGASGAGHFVKMVHNGIEYGLMEAYAEGFELLQAKKGLNLDLTRVAELWNQGSVIRSWLLELTAAELKQDPGLQHIQAYVEDSGEGRWTVQEALDLAVPLPAISAALQMRFRSRQTQPFGSRLLAALRHQFGGHPYLSNQDSAK